MSPLMITRALLRQWWIVGAGVAIGVGLAMVASTTSDRSYRATTSYYVSVAGQGAASAVDIAQGSAAAQQKIRSYIELASAPLVLQPVVESLDLDASASELSSRVTATVQNGTVIISIGVVDEDPKRAARVAEAVGVRLATVVAEIEPATADGKPSVRLEEVTPASVPTTPISPNVSSNLLLGVLAGTGVGATLALLRSALDTRVRSIADVDDLGVPLVGDIAFDSEADRRPLIVHDEANSVRAEAFRSLRTNIQFLHPGGPRTIAVTSARPSEGKTTTSTNLAIALAQSSLRTVIVDADLRRPNVAKTMGIEGAAGLTDLLVGRAEIDDVLQAWGENHLFVLPAGTVPPNPSELIGSEAMERLIDELATRFDVVLIDTPPVLAVTDAALISTLASTTLVVTAANQTKRSDVRNALEALGRVGEHANGLVLTKTKHKTSSYGAYRSAYTAN